MLTFNSNNISGSTVSATTLYSGSTNLSTLLTGLGGGSATLVQPGRNITTGGTSTAPTINLVITPFIDSISISGSSSLNNVTASAITNTTLVSSINIVGTSVTGNTLFSGATNLSTTIISIANAAAIANEDVTRVQAGNNITTGGTANAPSIAVSNTPTFVSLSAGTLSGGTIFSGNTNLSTTIINIATAAANAIDTAVQNGSNIVTGGTANTPTINLVSSPSLNGLILSGSGQFAGVTATSLSATTLSANTLFSGTTNLSTTIINLVNSVAGSSTLVQPGFNTYTGGTSATPSVNISAATLVNLSGGTVSGGTLFSGTTNLNTVIDRFSTRVQAGSNLTTGGTVNAPSVALIASPSINNLIASGISSTFANGLIGIGSFSGYGTSINFASSTGGTIISNGDLVISSPSNFNSIISSQSNLFIGNGIGTIFLSAATNATSISTNNINVTSTATTAILSASTISGNTFFSAGTSLGTIIGRRDISAYTYSYGLGTLTFNDTTSLVWTGGTQILTMSADSTSVSAQTSASTQILQFTLPANGTYSFNAFLRTGSSGAGGIKYILNGPGGSNCVLMFFGNTTSASLFTNFVQIGLSALTGTALNTNTFQNGFTQINGEITSGPIGGVFNLSYNAGTGGQTATMYRTGSTISINKIR